MNDLTMVLGSISHVTFQFQYLSKLTLTEHSPLMPYHFDINEFYQSKETGVVIDFTQPSAFYDNVKQTTAFGLKSVVYVPRIKADTISALSAFCEKASMQAAISASFHYNNVEIVESRAHATDLPSPDAVQIANNLSNLGQIYNREDLSTDVLARGQVLGEDGVRVHSMVLPGLPSSTTVYFSGPGEVYTIKHDITDVLSD
ncbi:putative 4-hydroxy-tetrahydrodipicolinate reductase 3 [Hibiscus syriacus]|uniref:4-hydroxy-tetrahydrodipicolinate reductase 3 n=1 Tax=Hibiscus syriacus TaxID=106335 RepID=A0A6A2YQ77_HIBSY|nr:putative 4-hydroxy-tetrahydrodipicolinate reductase 3 [Hibiscus syriacus]